MEFQVKGVVPEAITVPPEEPIRTVINVPAILAVEVKFVEAVTPVIWLYSL